MGERMPRVRRSLAERIAAATVLDPETGCMVWQWQTCSLGYGRMFVGKLKKQAHRIAFEIANGAVPAGLVLDHLCRNRACCNPDHLEAVPQAENIRRGVSWAAVNAKKAVCLRGHPLSGLNLLIRCDGARVCRTCLAARNARYRCQGAHA